MKDRLGGRQDSDTRKQIYQDRQTHELRVEAARVRRDLRLGARPAANGTSTFVDLDALLAALSPEQHVLFAASINVGTRGHRETRNGVDLLQSQLPLRGRRAPRQRAVRRAGDVVPPGDY